MSDFEQKSEERKSRERKSERAESERAKEQIPNPVQREGWHRTNNFSSSDCTVVYREEYDFLLEADPKG